ncbi:MAG: IS66 family insertion sequence element accessory protein TnpB [Gammaproteobacteria bacterium]|nr:IS66 family insertion sequence element accessory protein TnpB [Gammaproteobacteria bacterium]
MRDKRVRRGESGWREVLDRFASSGLSVEEFCRREGIATGSLYRWRKVLELPCRSGKAEPAAALPVPHRRPGFVDLGPVGVSGSPVEVHLELGDGIRLRLVRG